VRFDLLGPGIVLLRKLNGLLRVILKLDRVFVLLEVGSRAECRGNLVVALLLPAASVALDWRSVDD
jgi:hypothetical protein